jgi:hypothetical protein
MLTEWFKLLAIGALGALAVLMLMPFILYLLELTIFALAVIAASILLIVTVVSVFVIALPVSKVSKKASKELPSLMQSFKKVLERFTKLAKCIPNFANTPNYRSHSGNCQVCPPNYVSGNRKAMIEGDISQHCDICNLENKNPKEDGSNTTYKMVGKKTDKMLDVFHSAILFYKSYYEHSTKMEKNPAGYPA